MIKNGVLGKAIKTARTDKGYSQEQLAEMINVTPTHIKHIESEHRKPSLEVLFDLIEVLDISIDALINDDAQETTQYENAVRQLGKCSPEECCLIEDIIRAVIKNRS